MIVRAGSTSHTGFTASRVLALMTWLMAGLGLSGVANAAEAPAGSTVARHGALSVVDGAVVDAHHKPVAFSGVSYFWSNTGWGQEPFYNPSTVSYFVTEWKAGVIRAAIGAMGPGSLLEDPAGNEARLITLVQAAADNGVYVIIDWHSHRAEAHPDEAVAFFGRMAQTYGHLPNVIYEIYNEPLNDVTWGGTVKPYAQRVTDAIRAHDPDNLIIIGSPTWSQDVDIAAADPVIGTNIAYTMHFYAGSHTQSLRDKTSAALAAGQAVFVTEWGAVNANGDGAVATEEVARWVEYMQQHCLSNATWSVSNKAEGASIFKPGTSATGPWSDADLTPAGLAYKAVISGWDETCGAP